MFVQSWATIAHGRSEFDDRANPARVGLWPAWNFVRVTFFFLSLSPSALAASLQVAPVSIELPPGAKAAQLTLQNLSQAAIDAQIRVFRWSQKDGEEQLTPSADLVASPPAARLNPGQDYFVRLVRVSKKPVPTIVLALCSLGGPIAQASTATGTFTSSVVIQATCAVSSTNTLDFGTQGSLGSNTNTSATFAVQCTNTTPYNIGLDAGTTAGGTVATRKMTSGSATVNYKMFSDAGRTTNWGNTVGTDTVSGTGNGNAQTLTIYGQIPSQTTPAPATYTDTVTVTVTY